MIHLAKPMTCRVVSPSAASELAWVLDLLTQTAGYAEPALAELDVSLLPGVRNLRGPVKERAERLWGDGLAGCPELVPTAHLADCLLDEHPQRLFEWLADGRGKEQPALSARQRRLRDDARLRLSYRELLAEVWRLVEGSWEREGRASVVAACATWRARLDTGVPIEELVSPRHPLTRMDEHEFQEFALSPLYFCLSGGHVVDCGDFVHIAVSASDLLPVRKVRDAAFVADRLRVLAEPTRVHILLQLLSAPAGVMDVARVLRISQPTVSGHLKILREAGLVQPRRMGARTVFVGSRKRIERLLEDARATMARWD